MSKYLIWASREPSRRQIVSALFFAEAQIGLGMPLPMIPTKRLVVVPPFTYCRNPMVLGTVIGYFGFGVCLGSISAIAIVLVFAALLLLYVKVLEEEELEARFGVAYLDYKRTTPFLLPRVPKRPQPVNNPFERS